MLTLSLQGQAELNAQLGAMPDQLRAALTEKVDTLAQALLAQVVGVNLSGGVLNARSGALRNSIALLASDQDGQIGTQIFSDGDIPYAAIQEYGGKTAAHEILPDKAQTARLRHERQTGFCAQYSASGIANSRALLPAFCAGRARRRYRDSID